MSWTPSYRSTVLSSPSVTLEAPDFFSPSYHLVQSLEEISVRLNNMLKAVQILGCCSFGLVWRRRNSGGPSFISVSAKPLSYSSSSRRSTGRNSLFLAEFPARRSRYLRAFHASAACSESNPDGASSVAFHSSAGNIRKINFCQWCGGPTKHEIPHGEEKMRAICTVCRKIAYQNPKMVVGCLVEHEKKVLLCKRKIQPSYGLWTLPAGYMEMGESAVEGAIRETWEEANAEVEMLSPFAQLDIPLIGQTYIIFLAKLKKMQFSPGPESLECQLFALDAIPFNSLAFSSMLVTLNLYIEDVKAGKPKFHYCTINKRPGTSSSDIRAFTLDNHLQS